MCDANRTVTAAAVATTELANASANASNQVWSRDFIMDISFGIMGTVLGVASLWLALRHRKRLASENRGGGHRLNNGRDGRNCRVLDKEACRLAITPIKRSHSGK
ncbi:hypothetical protein B0O99DRAFT_746509 [Bisporella sp. PMI_857]|nr:hypothetical protein B0O99DRAFT_746509 [Bisporella sp. PMI_857]